MSKAVSRGQALEVSGRVGTQVDWDAIDGDVLQRGVIDLTPEEFSRRFTLFLKNNAQIIIGEPKVIPIDHSQPFDPAAFKGLGGGWTIWRGPKDGDGLKGDADQDSRAFALTEVDLTKIRFETGLEGKETSVKGETKLARLKKANHVRLDAKIFQTLWENQHLIPLQWKEKTNGNTTCIFFDGTVLRSPNGNRCVLYLYWHDGQWHWDAFWLERGWDANNPSAVLASES